MTDDHEVIKRADTAPARTVMHPLVAQVLQQNPTPEALRDLMALQRDWEAGEAKRAYTRALVDLRRDLPASIARDKTVEYQPQGKALVHYTHASLAAAMEAVTPHLITHGFALTWKTGTTEKGVCVSAVLTHRDGHSETSPPLTAPPDSSGNKSAPQAVASTITLLSRYSALALLGIATADMVEPTGDTTVDAGRIDSALNLTAAAELSKAGKSRESAEAFVGRPLQKWTAADLGKLKEWIAPKPTQFIATVTAVEKSPTLSNGKPWYSIGYAVDGKHGAASTFSEGDADLARSIHSRKELALLTLTENRVNLKSIEPYVEKTSL